jgi:hypothetical protein
MTPARGLPLFLEADPPPSISVPFITLGTAYWSASPAHLGAIRVHLFFDGWGQECPTTVPCRLDALTSTIF